ncbi:hypothetical protein FACS189425_09290 [Clostridia bacterium]|nr:hypothetical protein FACS189425_09290 [Clostridia bacterium]
MTTFALLNAVTDFVEHFTKDIILETRGRDINDDERQPDGASPPKVYQMRLPNEDSAFDFVPYIIVSVLTGTDIQEPGQEPKSTARIRIQCTTYSENHSKGAIDILNIIERLRIAFLTHREIGGQFQQISPLERIVYPHDTAPYFMGEMMVTFDLPPIHEKFDYQAFTIPILQHEREYSLETYTV